MKKLYTWTLTYKIFCIINYTIKYIKDKIQIAQIFYSNDFTNIISRYLNVKLKKDWLGRQYGVINPLIDIKGNLDVNNVIIELDGNNTNDDEYVKTWIIKQLTLVGNLFKINGLYNYIDMEIKPVGPIGFDNYLVIFDIVNRKQLHKYIKYVVYQIIIYLCIFLPIFYLVFLK